MHSQEICCQNNIVLETSLPVIRIRYELAARLELYALRDKLNVRGACTPFPIVRNARNKLYYLFGSSRLHLQSPQSRHCYT